MKKFLKILLVLFLAVLCFVGGFIGGYLGYFIYQTPIESEVYVSGDLQIHFLELGNKYTGDSIYIKAGDIDILIDAGSRTDSIPTITNYINQYITDSKIEYVIVSHAHQDHYAGFATNENVDSILDLYEIGTIIDFALTNQEPTGKMYSNYVRERSEAVERGATHYTAKQIIELDMSVITLSEGILMTILDQYYYHNSTSDENDYSVCTLFSYGDDHFLFTGDLEKDGEKSLIQMNDLPKVKLYKAGHHGSKTSSSAELLSVIQPEVVCVTCCCGSPEYTSNNENQFPTQDFINRVAIYTDEVYVTTLSVDYEKGVFTSMNGNIVVLVGLSGIEIKFTGSDLKLKDTEWFRENRTMPEAWG